MAARVDPAALAALRRHWGYPSFRPDQERAVRAVLRGRDVLAVLPTGGGKSICFQVPALLEPGLTLVVSPLISLMEDQVAGARRHGLPAAAISSASAAAGRAETARALRAGKLKLLYVSPERLRSSPFLRLLEQATVSRVAVDEAHCISEWGHDFRPAYRRIADLYERVGRPPVAAFTATATPRTRADIAASLRLRSPAEIVASVDRPNLRWRAERARGLDEAARRVLEAVRRSRGAAILYAATRGHAVRLAEAFRRLGRPAEPYHAGLPDGARREVQERFLAGKTPIVCATNAFGMGIDHPSVRRVCHLGLPGSLEAYVQEAGRAGRDGKRARCLLVSYRGDEDLQRRFIERSWPRARLLRRVWAAMPPGEPLASAAVRKRCAGRPDREAVESALRLLASWDCVRRTQGRRPPADGAAARPRSSAPNRGAPERYRRGPGPLRRRIDPAVLSRGRRRAGARLSALRGYLRTRRCRRAAIAAYFGEEPPRCAGCDRCRPSERAPQSR